MSNNSGVKKALLIVAISYLLYNVYQAALATVFLFEFPSTLNLFISNQAATFNVPLLLLQETAGSLGVYVRLVAGLFALQAAWLFAKGSNRVLKKFSRVLLLESIYFLLLLPSGINHVVTSVTNPGGFFNMYTGVSFVLQPLLIFPSLFMASQRLKQSQNVDFKWFGIAGICYVFALWVKHSLMWVYALVPFGNPQWSLMQYIGSADSLLTLLIAGIVAVAVYLMFEQKKKLDINLVGITLTLVGLYFVIYVLISIWVPVYLSFLELTEFWLIVLPVLAITVARRMP
ncbi:MAG: hypothetical protein PVI43_06070 [Candidatus Bathyarchaeota archaeon]|jgi:hypothetical protein